MPHGHILVYTYNHSVLIFGTLACRPNVLFLGGGTTNSADPDQMPFNCLITNHAYGILNFEL